MAKRKRSRPRPYPSPARRTAQSVEYILGKGTSRLLNARVDSHEIRLLVNGPTMLYGSCRLLTSLDAAEGATFQAWNTLARSLTCTSHCGLNGKSDIPVVVVPSRIGTCLEFGTGPMSMYLATVVLRPRRRGVTFRQVIDAAFGNPPRNYQAFIVPEPAATHLEHDGTIFAPSEFPPNAPEPDAPSGHVPHEAADDPVHETHDHRAPQPKRRSKGA